MKPYLRHLWQELGDSVEPLFTWREVHALHPDLKKWQARRLITAVRALGRPSGDVLTQPVKSSKVVLPPVERGTFVSEDGTEARHTDVEINARIMNIADLVEVAKINLALWEIVSHKVNTWSTVTKGDDGNPVVTRLWQVSASLRPRLVPLIRLDWPAPPVFVIPETLSAHSLRRAVVFPDMQIGFRWVGLAGGNPWAEPFHDRRAIDAALQILTRVQPDEVILIGDNLDFQPLSTRWPFADEARQTTQLAILEYRWLLYRMRQICPHARFIYMLGNHEARLAKYLDERAGELRGITHADGRRALDLREFLGLNDLQVETFDYPKPFWLWDRVEVEHGRVVRQGGGSTAAAILGKREHSVVYGHIHRRELGHRTIETPAGPREIFAGSPGCLCRTDGIVPGSDRPDWQQGVGLITWMAGADESMDVVRISHGTAVLGADIILGRDYVSELVAATGAAALHRQTTGAGASA